MRFVRRINDIYGAILSTELKDDLLDQRGASKDKLTVERVSAHVLKTIYRTTIPGPSALRRYCACTGRRRTPNGYATVSTDSSSRTLLHGDQDGEGEEDQQDVQELIPEPSIVSIETDSEEDPDHPLHGMDDCLSAITAENYYTSRLLKLSALYKQEAPRLAWEQNVGDIAILGCSFAASLLGAYHSSLWIPIVLGLSALLTTIKAFLGAGSQLVATNMALAGLSAIEVEWSALSSVERRTPRFKELLISFTEQQAVNVIQATIGTGATATSASKPQDMKRDDNSEDKDKDSGKDRKDKKDK